MSHVLFCVADQWRADALGAEGTPGVRTPHLDALAADGVLLANHWCQASPCGPSRSSLLTGTALPTHGQWSNDHPADHGLPTLPAVLRAAGIDPVLVGYTDTPRRGVAPPAGLIDPAFDVALAFTWQDGFPTWRDHLASRGYRLDDLDAHPFGLYAPAGEPDAGGLAPAHYHLEDSDVTFLTDAALDVIGRWSSVAAPSLLHLNWLRPHPPLAAPRPYHRLIDPDEVALPDRPLPLDEEVTRHPYFELTVPGRSIAQYLQRRGRVEDASERDDRFVRAAYYGLCAEVDGQVGRLVAELQRLGLYDSTLIIVTSDHGDSLGDHWLYGRRGPFDGHFRVPCLIRDPRPAADAGRGRRIDAFTANLDLLPTICEAMGVAAPPTVEGRSLLDLVHGRPVTGWRDHVRYDMSWHDQLPRRLRVSTRAGDHRFSAIRTDRYRLVTFPRLPPLLFDLADDPGETIDRSADPSLATTLGDLTTLLR